MYMQWAVLAIICQFARTLHPEHQQPSTAIGNVFQHEARKGDLNRVFKGVDRDGDGFLGKEELQGFLRRQKQTPVVYPKPSPIRYTRQRSRSAPNGVNGTVRMWNQTAISAQPIRHDSEVTQVAPPSAAHAPRVPDAAETAAGKAVTVPMGPIANGLKSRVSMAPVEEPKHVGPPPPCLCKEDSSTWRRPARTTPSCFFFDFGAGDGETFRAFLGQSRKWQFKFNTAPFRPQDCFVYLMDPNPKYQMALKDITALLPVGQAMYVPETAAYMCDSDNATFYLDVTSPQGWGSSLDPDHESVKDTAATSNVSVSLTNIMRLLRENTIPSDTVIVKLDIEGAEWDLLPCLANSSSASLIDTLYLESHCHTNHETKMKWCPSNGLKDNSQEVFDWSLSSIRMKGVDVPDYWSPLLL